MEIFEFYPLNCDNTVQVGLHPPNPNSLEFGFFVARSTRLSVSTYWQGAPDSRPSGTTS